MQNNSEPQDTMSCKKNDHDQSEFAYFKFSQKKDEILQCINCNVEDLQIDKKIVIEKFLKLPVWKINNFPPLKDQKKDKKIRKIIEESLQENQQKFKQYILQQIESQYNQINNDFIEALKKSKKKVIQEFEQLFEKFQDFSGLYDVEPLKKMLQKFKNNEVNLDQLFEKQLQMKNEFEKEEKIEILEKQKQLQEQVENKLKKLEQQIKEKSEIFQRELSSLYENDNNNLQQQLQQQDLVVFQKSDHEGNPKDCINIFYKRGIKNIQFDDKIKVWKTIISQNLRKDKTYFMRFKINFHGQRKQYLAFHLLNQKTKLDNWGYAQSIYLIDTKGNCGAYGGKQNFVSGERFSDFWEDDVTVLNVVISYTQQQFLIYDDQKRGVISNYIDVNKIKQEDDLMFGINCYQYQKNKIDLMFLEIKAS
ncbi:hypothetical protein PPERSA_08300 [Pseudocohnilembus persalinus]|uniref:Uncharacterized protein n=1 Tax=Pseudocohnilembus persalinus TaxID=266149 RepID=A0A0V0QQ19_PSEPJ|nr:hypothetical protein PPERSA_08300 [Pseudocohnilembus persalinus]|eukprot:KRX04085.1 hypothetical protein PPERSA_08300 [Pseudocohnilembus persalinus]